MLFRRTKDGEPPHRQVATVRDVIEILAIVAAGIWAIYVFVYTDKIEPFQRPSAPAVDASISVAGTKGDLLALRLRQSIRNTGPSVLYVLGSVATVIGTDVRIPDGRNIRALRLKDQIVEQRFSDSHLEEAYVYAYTAPMTVGSGETWEHSWIAYVPRNRYDALIFDPIFYFTRDANAEVPLHTTRNPRGVLLLEGPKDCDARGLCPQQIGSEIQISLW